MITKVTGVTFINDDGISRASIISSMSILDEIVLVRDPYNLYDSNAIKVCVKKGDKEHQIGFVEKGLASKLSPKMRKGVSFKVIVDSCGVYMDRPYCNINLIGVEYGYDGELIFSM